MNRDVLLAAKAAELTQSLQEWARNNLSAGEQLLVSLRIQDVPAAVIDPKDAAASTENLLNTKVLDYFTPERLERFPSGVGIPVRTRTCFRNDGPGYYDNMSLGQFVEGVSEAELLRTPNFGRSCLALVLNVLKEDGLELKRH